MTEELQKPVAGEIGCFDFKLLLVSQIRMKHFKNLLHKKLICTCINEFGCSLVKSFALSSDENELFEKFVARKVNLDESK